MQTSSSTYQTIHHTISELLFPVGFECHPFKIGWYNDKVKKEFHFPYNPDTLAFIIVSTPKMFDKAFKPFIVRQECTGIQDPIDQCMKHYFSLIRQAFSDIEVDTVHDFEMHHNHRPKILVQTAGHVGGAAYYYQRLDIKCDPWPEDKKMFGISIHPEYGGWFAFRGAVIFPSVQYSELSYKPPVDCVSTDEKRIELLERLNNNWEDWTYRDIIPTIDKYSEEQKEYFATKPKDRQEIIQRLKTCVS